MTPEAACASYARMCTDRVTVRRYTGTGSNRPRFDAENLPARVMGYQPHELVGGIIQGDSKVILPVAGLIAAQFPLPLKKGDKVLIQGREANIEAVDDKTRRVGTDLIAYELTVRG